MGHIRFAVQDDPESLSVMLNYHEQLIVTVGHLLIRLGQQPASGTA
jgi:hypothetical protein